MADHHKPTTTAGYPTEQVHMVQATCLYIATKLGDLIDDMVIVGGLVPTLLIDQTRLSEGVDPHVGTTDLDVGLTITILEQGRYRTLTERLRRAGFSPDRNIKGRLTSQRWKPTSAGTVTVDFLIPPSLEGDRGGTLRHIEPDFAAIITPGLHLAFEDRVRVTLSGTTIMAEQAKRSVWVCGPGAYVILKAIAFDQRGENKDAYDLYYLVRNFGAGLNEVASRIRPLLGDPVARKAMAVIQRDFTARDKVGPTRVAEFLTGTRNAEIQADVAGYCTALLRILSADTTK